MVSLLTTERRPRRLVRCFALTICAFAISCGAVFGDTLRSELYRFEVSDTCVSETVYGSAGPPVYVRVTGAKDALRDVTNGVACDVRKVADRFALFEFYVKDAVNGLSLQKVRFHDRNQWLAGEPGKDVHKLATDNRTFATNPISASPDMARHDSSIWTPTSLSSASGAVSKSGFVNSPSNTTRTGGVRSFDVASVLFKLTQGETVDTLIDERLAGGELQLDVQLRTTDGTTFWATLIRPVSVDGAVPSDSSTLWDCTRLPVASRVPSTKNTASQGGRKLLFSAVDCEPCSYDLALKTPATVPNGRRAREPPSRDI